MKMKWTLIFSLFACAASAAELDRKLYQKIWPSLVRVHAVLDQGKTATGSGVVDAPDKVISNCHVTRDARAIDIFAWNQQWKVKEQAKDIDHDLCLLSLTRDIGKPIEFGDLDAIKVGQEVIAAGYPGGGRLEVSEGQVRGLHPLDQANVIQTSAPFDSGESGGGLFDRNGKLLGVITFKLPAGESYFFAVPASWVKKLMEARTTEFEGTKKIVAFWERLPDNQPPFLRAIAREAAEDWRGLLLYADQWSQEDPTNPETWIALGKSQFQLARYSEAIAALKKATELAPDHPQAWTYLARSYKNNGENAAFAAALEKLNQLDVIAARSIGATNTR